MLVLLLDVATDCVALRSAYCKRAITFLPCKLAHADLIVHPSGRNRLQLAKHISKAVCRAKANQKMHMIGDAADAFGDSIRRADDSTKVRV